MLDGAPHEYKEKPGCPDCGNSPVNHIEAYISSSLSVLSSGKKPGIVRRFSDRLYDMLEPLLFRMFAALSRFGTDPSKARTYRSQVVWEEAARRGIAMEQMVLFGLHTDIYRAKLAHGWTYFISLPIPPERRGGGSDWMDDKLLFKQALMRSDIPTPHIVSVTKLRDARDAMDEWGSVVVKPRSGSRGRHTTVNVSTHEELERAFRVAKRLCHYVAIEQYLEGSVCRATVVDGKLAGFFQAQPPRVVGDGTSTIAMLIEQQNAARPERVQPIVLTDEHHRFLARLGLYEHSVLESGCGIALTHRTGRLFGGHTRELLSTVHPKLRAYAERAAQALDTSIVGFDLIIVDPERDPDEQRWGFIEANSLPYIDLHYLPLTGEPSNVASAVWDMWGDRTHVTKKSPILAQ